jgi:hypothetical protein
VYLATTTFGIQSLAFPHCSSAKQHIPSIKDLGMNRAAVFNSVIDQTLGPLTW